jgi:hypothetical protein
MKAVGRWAVDVEDLELGTGMGLSLRTISPVPSGQAERSTR